MDENMNTGAAPEANPMEAPTTPEQPAAAPEANPMEAPAEGENAGM